jgi:hypothetical protein
MLLGPSLANFGNKLVLGSAHLADQRLVAGFFVAVGQNVAGDFFVGMQKFVKRFVAAEHHVAQDLAICK